MTIDFFLCCGEKKFLLSNSEFICKINLLIVFFEEIFNDFLSLLNLFKLIYLNISKQINITECERFIDEKFFLVGICII